MKSLLVSDIHTSYRMLSSVFEASKKEKSLDLIIFSGDLVDMGEPVSFVDEFIWLIEQLNISLLWVPGNNDFGRAYHKLNARYRSLEGKITKFADHKFTGVGGSPASWAGQYQGESIIDKKAIAGSIFVSHVPPPGVHNYQKYDPKKSTSTRKFSDAPKVHICGHIHHQWGVAYLGQTKIIKLAAGYLGYYAIMDLDSLEVAFGRMWK